VTPTDFDKRVSSLCLEAVTVLVMRIVIQFQCGDLLAESGDGEGRTAGVRT